jgi:hypothetical protein
MIVMFMNVLQASIDPVHQRLVSRLEDKEYDLEAGLEWIKSEADSGLIIPTELAAGSYIPSLKYSPSSLSCS